jgi:hypothetical protein
VETEDSSSEVVRAWIGNSKPVAAKRCLQVTDEHFQKAAHKPAQLPDGGGAENHLQLWEKHSARAAQIPAQSALDGGDADGLDSHDTAKTLGKVEG